MLDGDERRPRSLGRSRHRPAVDPAARPQRGEEVELEIDTLAFGGAGVARREGYVIFVAGAVPGDRVRAVITKRKRSHAEARTLEVLFPGPDRVAPLADHPGVPWQVLSYERQLEIKQAQVLEALSRIGHLEGSRPGRSSPPSSSGAIATSSSTRSAPTRMASSCAASTSRAAGTGWWPWRTACWRPSWATTRGAGCSSGPVVPA